MTDNRMPDDTLYLIFEEDFRFTDEYDVKSERIALKINVDGSAYPSKESLSPCIASGSRGIERLRGRYYEVPTKAGAEEYTEESTSRYLTDLMHLCTHAHRAGRGDLVWLSWAPEGAGPHCKSKRLRGASTLIACTKEGAKGIGEAMGDQSLSPAHSGVQLREWLRKGGQQIIKFAYLMPPMGCWAEHVVSVDKGWTKKGGAQAIGVSPGCAQGHGRQMVGSTAKNGGAA